MAVENKMEINQYGTAFVANFTWVMRYLLTPQTPPSGISIMKSLHFMQGIPNKNYLTALMYPVNL